MRAEARPQGREGQQRDGQQREGQQREVEGSKGKGRVGVGQRRVRGTRTVSPVFDLLVFESANGG